MYIYFIWVRFNQIHMNRLIICCALIALFLTQSCTVQTQCGTKESFITNYDKFINDLRQHHDEISDNHWDSVEKEFKLYVDECYPKHKVQMTTSEKLEFWKNTLSYGLYKGSQDGDLTLDFDNVDIDISDELDNISIESKEELERFIKEEFGTDIEDAVDDLVDGIKEIGDEIKSWLKEKK